MNFWKLWEWYLSSYSWPEGSQKVGSQRKDVQYSVSMRFSTLMGCKVDSGTCDSVLLQERIRKLTFWLEAGCSWTGSRANHNVLSRGTDSIRISDLMAKSNQLANKQTIVCVCWIHWHAFSSLTRPSAHSHLESNLAVPTSSMWEVKMYTFSLICPRGWWEDFWDNKHKAIWASYQKVLLEYKLFLALPLFCGLKQ